MTWSIEYKNYGGKERPRVHCVIQFNGQFRGNLYLPKEEFNTFQRAFPDFEFSEAKEKAA